MDHDHVIVSLDQNGHFNKKPHNHSSYFYGSKCLVVRPMTSEYFYFVFVCGTNLHGHGWLQLLAKPLCHRVFEFKLFLNGSIHFYIYLMTLWQPDPPR
jgi:hypothetical protein